MSKGYVSDVNLEHIQSIHDRFNQIMYFDGYFPSVASHYESEIDMYKLYWKLRGSLWEHYE